MSTRSLTLIHDQNGQEIVVMYRHSDGYPSGHGQDLADFLKGIIITNGISVGQPERTANGMECLAAQLICHFKQQFPLGGIYLYPAKTRDCGEEYQYTVTQKGNQVRLQAEEVHWYNGKGRLSKPKRKTLYEGAPDNFNGETLEKEA